MPYKDKLKAKEASRKSSLKYYWKNRDIQIKKMAEYRKTDGFKKSQKKLLDKRRGDPKRIEYHRKYRESNVDYFKNYRINNKENIMRYRLENKDRINAWYKEYRAKNPFHKYYSKNRESLREKAKNKYYSNLEYSRLMGRIYMHRRRVLCKKITKIMIDKIFEDNFKSNGFMKCCICNKEIIGKYSIEHKLPVSRGGKNDYDNLGIAHPFCNYSKRNRTMEEYSEYIKNREVV